MLEAARGYLRRGWRVVPLETRGKRCLHRSWPDLRLKASDLEDYFGADENVGVLLGEPSDSCTDVDLDCAEALVLADTLLPPTDSEFGRAGRSRGHRLYRAPGAQTVKYEDPEQDGSGAMLVELRSTRCQTMAPPSIHPSGEPVEWHRDGLRADIQADELRRSVGLLAAASLLLRAHPKDGARHEYAVEMAGALLRSPLAEEQVLVMVEAVARAAGDRDIRDRIAAVISSGRRIAAGDATTGWPTLARRIGEKRADAIREWIGGDVRPATAPWEAPIPLDRPHARTRIPISKWPEWVRQYVHALAVAFQVPSELPAMVALAAIAGGVARKLALRIRPDWIEALALWCVVALPPSERKSPPLERIRAPILAHEEKRNAELAPVIRDAEAKRDLLIERVKHFRQKAAKAVGEARAEAEQEVRNAEGEIAAVVVPAAVVEMVDDVTVERLATLMVENGERMLILSDEGGIWDTIAGRYAGDHASANLDLWLRGYSGSEHRVHRGSRPPDYLRRPAITMGITVQPIVLERLASHDGFVGRGVVARPLYAVPHPMAGYRDKGEPPPVPPALERAWATQLRGLYEIATPKEPTELTLTAAARRRFVAWCDDLEPRRRPDGDLSSVLGEWAGKLPGQIARIAVVLHCARHAGGPIPAEVAIEDTDAAIEMADYLIDHARVALGMMGADPAVSDARRVLHAAAPYAGKDVRRGALHRATRLDRRRLDEAVRVLVEYGWLRPVSLDGTAQTGRPATVYRVHPAAGPVREHPLGCSGSNGVNGRPANEGEHFEPIEPETPCENGGQADQDESDDEVAL